MANKEQVERLKHGVEGWNKWREENPEIEIDLSEANLGNAKLSRANLFEVNLRGASLIEANITSTDLSYADLSRATIVSSSLNYSNLEGTILTKADLRNSVLILTIFNKSILDKTRFNKTLIGSTFFGEIDLSNTYGLEEINHSGPSTIGTNTIKESKGRIPETFLRGCGLSDWEIESAKLYKPRISAKEVDDILYRIHDLKCNQALQINPLFISYCHADGDFVDSIETHLDDRGIRFWRDIHDATAGRLEKVVDRAIRQNPTVLLVLSENSVKSDWVEHEARKARELEKELGRDVMCPVALDDAWKDCHWPERLREQIMEYNIMDFSKWRDKKEFEKKFVKLIEGLDLFYKEK